jgi:hypothetical protein
MLETPCTCGGKVPFEGINETREALRVGDTVYLETALAALGAIIIGIALVLLVSAGME